MFFYDKNMLREIGKDEAFIEGLPAMVESGEFTIYDMTDLAKEVVDGGAAKYGIVHRPNVGPDFQMLMKSFGIDQYDAEAGKLQMSESKLADFFEWLKYGVDAGRHPGQHDGLVLGRGARLLPSRRRPRSSSSTASGTCRPSSRPAAWTRIATSTRSAGRTARRPSRVASPPISRTRSSTPSRSTSEHPELAAYLVGLASQNYLNTEHAVTTGHTPINYSQTAMRRFIEEGWALSAGAPLLDYAAFMPNHASIGQYNALLFKGIEAVETGRLEPKDAATFVVEELQAELGDDVVILE